MFLTHLALCTAQILAAALLVSLFPSPYSIAGYLGPVVALGIAWYRGLR